MVAPHEVTLVCPPPKPAGSTLPLNSYNVPPGEVSLKFPNPSAPVLLASSSISSCPGSLSPVASSSKRNPFTVSVLLRNVGICSAQPPLLKSVVSSSVLPPPNSKVSIPPTGTKVPELFSTSNTQSRAKTLVKAIYITPLSFSMR